MTTKRVVYATPDGGLAIIVPANKFIAEIEAAGSLLGQSFTQEQLAAVACGKALAGAAGGSDPLMCDVADLPSDRTFRGAWKRAGAKPAEVNMDKALEIARDHIRAARAPLFAPLDVAVQRAQETKDAEAEAAAIAAKEKLRAAPDDARLTAAATPDELKAAMGAVVTELTA